MKYLRIAFNLLTTLPIPAPKDWQPGDSGRAGKWYPLVGLVMGSIVAGVFYLTSLTFPSLVVGSLCLVVWVFLTGGLHLDGLADCCDGLFHASNPQRRLEIMKDPHLGAFGAIGLGLALLLKFVMLVSLAPERALLTILLAASLSRWTILPAGFQPLARQGGMGADFTAGLRKSSLAWGAIVPLILAGLLGWHGLLSLAVTFLVVVGLLRFSRMRIGGVTGDVFGLLVEVVEITVLLIGTL